MAQRTKRSLPRSAFATPGMVGQGDDGMVPNDDKFAPGLQKVLVARTASISKIRAPHFVFLTTKNRKEGGGRPERGVFLVMSMMIVKGRPQVVAIFGCWVLDKRDYNTHYNVSGILAGDPVSKSTFEAMSEDGLILDLNWRDTGGLCEVEPLIRVSRGGGARNCTAPCSLPTFAPCCC